MSFSEIVSVFFRHNEDALSLCFNFEGKLSTARLAVPDRSNIDVSSRLPRISLRNAEIYVGALGFYRDGIFLRTQRAMLMMQYEQLLLDDDEFLVDALQEHGDFIALLAPADQRVSITPVISRRVRLTHL